MMAPGSTLARRSIGSNSMMRLKYLELSTTIPGPIELPAMEVPAPRIVNGIEKSRATSRTAERSSLLLGKTTTCGTIR